MIYMAKVTINNIEHEYSVGTTFEQIANDMQSEYKDRIILANVDGQIYELNKELVKDCTLDFRTVTSRAGFHTYRRTAELILMKAIYDLYSGKIDRVKAEFAVDNGLYCTMFGSVSIDDEFITAVTDRMQKIIDDDIAIEKSSFHIDDACKLLEKQKLHGSTKLFKFRRMNRVNLYSLGDYFDYFYGHLAPSTGYLNAFKLYAFEDGFVMQLPTKHDINTVPEFNPQMKLYRTMKEIDEIGRKLSVETVGDLNEAICSGSFEQLRLVTEALQEGKISDIASDIASKDKVKFVMIAGPSSSGKTSFSYRLSTQLSAKGKTPYPIGLDNYYKDREFCPRDENGDYDFECLESIDVEGFNKDMTRLLNGETVDIPVFNFKSGKREYHGNYIKLNEGDILVIEGIHGLNEKMSYALPKESKYKVYISALTSLNVDDHNRIPTTDVRLLRRMVRDNRTRGTKASGTIAMWDSVRRGEEKYIFPFQEEADAMFNSSLVYELAILKQFAEPLLFDIDVTDNAYHEAKRLLKFLDFFLGVTSEHLPNNSLLREFVGGSVFNV